MEHPEAPKRIEPGAAAALTDLVFGLTSEIEDTKQACKQLIADASENGGVGPASTLVLYFPTNADREEFIAAFHAVKPNCKAVEM